MSFMRSLAKQHYSILVKNAIIGFSVSQGSAEPLHFVSKKDTTQPPMIISTILVRFQ